MLKEYLIVHHHTRKVLAYATDWLRATCLLLGCFDDGIDVELYEATWDRTDGEQLDLLKTLVH